MTDPVPTKRPFGFGLSFVAALLATVCTVIALDEFRRTATGVSTFDSINTAGAGALVLVLALGYYLRMAFMKSLPSSTRLKVLRSVQLFLTLALAAAAIGSFIAVATRFATEEAISFIIVGDILHIGTILWLFRYSREGS